MYLGFTQKCLKKYNILWFGITNTICTTAFIQPMNIKLYQVILILQSTIYYCWSSGVSIFICFFSIIMHHFVYNAIFHLECWSAINARYQEMHPSPVRLPIAITVSTREFLRRMVFVCFLLTCMVYHKRSSAAAVT